MEEPRPGSSSLPLLVLGEESLTASVPSLKMAMIQQQCYCEYYAADKQSLSVFVINKYECVVSHPKSPPARGKKAAG
jgi:hypothetical protein